MRRWSHQEQRLERICFFQAEDDIRDAQESRELGDVYKRQVLPMIRDGPASRCDWVLPIIRDGPPSRCD